MKLDVLAFAAHPDDADIAVGGTLARMAKMGYKVGVVDLTRGERGTRGTAETRARELQEAARLLGLAVRDNLDIGDTMVSITRPNQVKVVEAIRKYRPATVILAPNDMRHPDHTNAERLTFEGCYFAGLKNFEGAGEPYRPGKILQVHRFRDGGRPTFVVDISETFETKLAAVAAFASQFPPEEGRPGLVSFNELRERLTIRARWYGMMIGKKYGEGFVQQEVMEVDDIVKLPVRSI